MVVPFTSRPPKQTPHFGPTLRERRIAGALPRCRFADWYFTNGARGASHCLPLFIFRTPGFSVNRPSSSILNRPAARCADPPRTMASPCRTRSGKKTRTILSTDPCVVPEAAKRTTLNTEVPGSDFDHFEILLAGPALRACPVRRNLFPPCSRCDTCLRDPCGLVVDPAADQAHPGPHCNASCHRSGGHRTKSQVNR